MTTPPSRSGDRLFRSLLVLVSICILGLLAGIVLSYVYAQNVDHRLGRLEQYVQGRGEYRDQEQRRLEEQIRRSTCDLLDQLPAGGLLERPRAKYHCGPGLPLSSLPTQEQKQLHHPQTTAPPATPPARPSTSRPAPAAPSANTPSRPAAHSAPPKTSAPPRPGPLAPITDPVCGAVGVCP